MKGGTNQSGFSLVEVLVTLAISLILLAGVWNMFLASRQAYRTNEALSQVQENGRFAVDLLSREVRVAGYKGACGSDTPINNLLNPAGAGYDADLYNLDNAFLGWEDSDPGAAYAASMSGYRAGTDVILFKHAAIASSATASGNTPANANTITLSGASGIAQDTIVVVSDSDGCDIFQNRSNASASTLTRGNTGQPGNLNPASVNFSHEYGPGMEIRTFRSGLYYVGTGTDGSPALRRALFDQGNSPDDQLLADGVEDMQVTYGEDTNGDGRVDRYCRADAIASWANVLALRATLLVASTAPNVLSEPQSLAYDDGAADPDGVCTATEFEPDTSDRQLRQVFTTTIGIRNRLP